MRESETMDGSLDVEGCPCYLLMLVLTRRPEWELSSEEVFPCP